MSVVNLTYFLVLLLPPAAVEGRPASAAVSRSADAGAKDACLPAPRRGPGASWLKRSVPPVPPSTFATATAIPAAWAAQVAVAPPPVLSGTRLLYLLMSLLR
jgi:hypothetical protein